MSEGQAISFEVSNGKFLFRYTDTVKFWMARADAHSTPNSSIWPSADGYWRQRAKRTFRGFYLANRTKLMWHWLDFLVSCEYGGRSCEMDPDSMQMPTAVITPEGEGNLARQGAARLNWESPGLLRPIASISDELPSSWPGGAPDPAIMNKIPQQWPRGKIIMVDHPSKYLCFQVRLYVGTYIHIYI